MQRCMVMIWQNAALSVAGIVGAGVAVAHGLLVQRHMVKPFEATALDDRRFSSVTRRLMPPLLHFSTFVWFLGGLALIVAAASLPREPRLAISLLVGVTYLFGVVFNFWATRGRHPGWILLAVAMTLIVASAIEPGT